MDPHRHDRVTEGIREELEELINYELTDPRITSVTIPVVHVSPDYRHALIMLAATGTPAEQAQTLEAVEHAKQYLKHQLTDRLQLFKTPDLRFEAALAADLAAKAPKILRRMKRGRTKAESAEKSPQKSGLS
ncbi:MAG: 30S ribosome-binding factor RbfA [Acidobacteriota bacterium]